MQSRAQSGNILECTKGEAFLDELSSQLVLVVELQKCMQESDTSYEKDVPNSRMLTFRQVLDSSVIWRSIASDFVLPAFLVETRTLERVRQHISELYYQVSPARLRCK